MTNLVKKIGLVLGATAIVAGNVYAAPKQDGVKFTAPNYQGVNIEYSSKDGRWGYDSNPKDGKNEWKKSTDQRRVDGQYDQHLFAKAQIDALNKALKTKTQQVTQSVAPKKSPAQITKEHCDENPELCPNKPVYKTEKVTEEAGAKITGKPAETLRQSEEPSNGYWVFSAGGDSNDRAFGQFGYRWKVGNDNRNRLGLELRAYSKSPVEQVGTSEKITSVDEALVGPGIYITRTDEETIETDRKLGRLGLIAHFGYLPEYFRNQLELFGNVGATSYDETKQTRLKTTVKLEDSEGKPIGNSETATQRLEPEKETHIIPIVELGINWHIPNTNILLGVSEEISPDLGAKTNAKFGLKF